MSAGAKFLRVQREKGPRIPANVAWYFGPRFLRSGFFFLKKGPYLTPPLLDGEKLCDIIGAKFHIRISTPEFHIEYLPLVVLLVIDQEKSTYSRMLAGMIFTK